MNKIQLGIAPIGWSNDDMPELGGHISFEQCIREMAEADYQGCEVGNKFSREAEKLHQSLAPHQLRVASAWFSTYFTEPARREETLTGFIQHRHFLHAMGAKVIVVCECGHSIQGKNLPLKQNKPVFNPHQWDLLLQGLRKISELAAAQNMAIVYHPHMGTGIQNEDEIDKLMSNTSSDEVFLLLDTGHLYFAGCHPLPVLKKYAERIKHVHLKDIRSSVLADVHRHELGFLDAVKAGVFTVPGDGCIEFQPILDELLNRNYEGWWVVEAEQDPDKANPLQYAKMAREYIRRTAGF